LEAGDGFVGFVDFFFGFGRFLAQRFNLVNKSPLFGVMFGLALADLFRILLGRL
jgi:hypothetical protein